MAKDSQTLANGATRIDFATDPLRYRHWSLRIDGEIATLTLDVDENGGLFNGYPLKLNSYDLGVDIELADAYQRLRFEYPAVKVVVLCSGKPRVFCAGANIRMLAGATHQHKVNFCKFTNETRNTIEEASETSGIKTLCVVNGTAAGGGYELALATDCILLVDDGTAAVSLPEVPLLAVLPGTGGLTRLVDKRKVRRDRADAFCTIEEGVRGKRAIDWRLVDELVPQSRIENATIARAQALAATSPRTGPKNGTSLLPIQRTFRPDGVAYSHVNVEIDRNLRAATVTIQGPAIVPPTDTDAMIAAGASFWPLAVARELDDAILHLRNNEYDIGTIVFKSLGDGSLVASYDGCLETNKTHWLATEIRAYWKRVLKRIDVTSRTLVASVEPGSCFAGMLAELIFAADRAYMLIGQLTGDNRSPARIILTQSNFGIYPMANSLTRLATRFLGTPEVIDLLAGKIGEEIDGLEADQLGLVTFALDEIDWADETRIFMEERASFSPDALTGLEASLRFPGPETMESKIFARLTAWQNWIFQRPNAVGPEGALQRYGTGQKPKFDHVRV